MSKDGSDMDVNQENDDSKNEFYTALAVLLSFLCLLGLFLHCHRRNIRICKREKRKDKDVQIEEL